MKDLTRGLGAVAQAVSPNIPQHHGGGISGVTSGIVPLFHSSFNSTSSILDLKYPFVLESDRLLPDQN